MINVCASGILPRMYAQSFDRRKFVAQTFDEMKAYFDKLRADEWYGVYNIKIHSIDGATYQEIVDNEDWLRECDYFFFIIGKDVM